MPIKKSPIVQIKTYQTVRKNKINYIKSMVKHEHKEIGIVIITAKLKLNKVG
jgi:hypothetical protein